MVKLRIFQRNSLSARARAFGNSEAHEHLGILVLVEKQLGVEPDRTISINYHRISVTKGSGSSYMKVPTILSLIHI